METDTLANEDCIKMQPINAIQPDRSEDGPLAGAVLRQVLVDWNDTRVDYPQDVCLHQLFEAQAARTPDAVALVFEDRQLTYRELDERANQLAHHLRSLGVGTETFVGICLERSIEMVVGLYGTMKAGAVYVPIDPTYPQDRLTFMLQDANTPVLLTQEKLAAKLPPHQAKTVCLDSEWPVIARQSTASPNIALTPDNLAYMIYTSGSTGKPKGAMNTHRGICNRLLWMQDAYQLKADDRVMQKTPFSFDVSVWEFFWPLLAGARLVVARPEGHRDAAYLVELINAQQITTLHFVPSMLQVFLREPRVESCRSLRRVICSGEALPYELQETFFGRLPAVELHNLYGPTEAAVDVTYWACQKGSPLRTVPIGKPIANIQMYVLDPQLKPVPPGEPGELHIGGVGLARGYHNRPELTAEKFIPDPFSEKPGARLYKTGDLARHMPDGNIEYLGRLDHQVKIRGFRIELGEIESVLAQHPGVAETVVVARGDVPGEKRLVAYLVSAGATAPTVSDLHAHLKLQLPDYMVPAAFVVLKEMPLSPNGKVDRKALPAPDQSRPELKDAFVAPQTEQENILAGIWAEVLEVSPIGVNDNFFELGGDSIRAIQLLARAQKSGLRISLEQLFEQQTIHKVVEELKKHQTAGGTAARVEPFALVAAEDRQRLPADLEDAYPMTKLQMGMFYHNELNPVSAVFHDVFSFRIQFAFDRDKLAVALRQFIGRHQSMRTSFEMAGYSEPLQLVHKTAQVPFTVEDLQALMPDEQTAKITGWIGAEKYRAFDRTKAPLLRIHAQRLSPDHFQLIVSFHHSVLDGWSLAAMLTELLQDYSALIKGGGEVVTGPTVAYRDYVVLEREAMASEPVRRFWAEKLAEPNIQMLPRWPQSYCAGGTEQNRGPEILFPAEVFEGLKRLAQMAGVPLKSVLQAAHYRVMSLLTGTSDVISGLVTNGRPEEIDGEKLMGLFLNTIPLRMKMDGGTWVDLARQVFAAERELIPNRRMPLSEIQQIAGNQTVFETVFDFVHFHVYRNLQGYQDMGFMEAHYFEANNFTLYTTFMLDVTMTQLQMHFDYDPEKLATEQVRLMCEHYANTLAAMAAQPLGRYEAFSPLSADERNRLLTEWNDTGAAYPQDALIDALVERQAQQTPESVAVVCGDRQLTYRELNQQADQLAERLRAMGVGPDALVAIFVERSLEMLVGLLGVLKAGGAYIPLDPIYPPDRIAFMLEDAQPVVLLTQTSLQSVVPSHKAQVVLLDAPDSQKGTPAKAQPSPRKRQPTDMAYVLYTSGSTGKPKGVQIPHRAVVNFLASMRREPGLNAADALLAVTTLSFDIAGLELWLPLTAGARVVVASREDAADGVQLARLISESGATMMQATPVTWRLLLQSGWGGNPKLKILCGGEALAPDLAAQLVSLCGEVWNMYGPTETTIWSAACRVKRDEPVVIGRPIANTDFYVVDQRLQPAPIGVPGELLIGGDGVARGYLNRPELTAEKFIANPFSAKPDARLYRTGDLVRYLPDGNIEFLGRMDFQIKIRGFRVELSEIEAVLRSHAGVKDAVVVARDDNRGEKQLVAYVVPAQEPGPAQAELRNHVRQQLPDYMTPAIFMTLTELPLTPNGKVNRKALPAPDQTRPELAEQFQAPRDELEQQLAKLWEDIFSIERVGVRDNFFELGGHSLLAVRLFAQVKKLTGKDLPLVTLFEAPTIEQLAAILRQQGWESPWASLVPIKPGGSKPPFYCVHGVGGNILEYLDLAKYVDGDQPFYGLQAIGLDGKRPIENLNVEQMAARYIEEVRAFQPRGPYYLGGSSFGGLVAYEMAQQLRAAGEEIGLLAFFDTNGPGYPQLLPTTTALQRKIEWWQDRVALHWGNLRASSGREKLTYVREKAQRWKKQMRWRRQHLWDQARERVARIFWPEAIRQARAVGYRAGTTYAPRPYEGSATLFRATEQPRGIVEDRALGWGALVKGGLEIYDTPGHHGAIVREPRARELAAQLKDALQKAKDRAKTATDLAAAMPGVEVMESRDEAAAPVSVR